MIKSILLIVRSFAGVVLIAFVASLSIGTQQVLHTLHSAKTVWIVALVGLELADYSAYIISYRFLFRLSFKEAAKRTYYGFSPLASLGGFYYDRKFDPVSQRRTVGLGLA